MESAATAPTEARPFELTEPMRPGKVPHEVISELEQLADAMIDATKDFALACKEQGNKFGVSRPALRRYVCARRSDKLAQLDAEALGILSLIEQEQQQ